MINIFLRFYFDGVFFIDIIGATPIVGGGGGEFGYSMKIPVISGNDGSDSSVG